MRIEGFIRTWNDERGFGFIQPAQGGDDIFVHVKAFSTRTARPQVNERVWFDIEQGPGGKMRACNVEAVRAHRPTAHRQRSLRPRPRTTGLIAIPVFLCIYVAASVKWHPPIEIALVYLLASIAAFIAYAADKSAARRGDWRTPENTLHVLSLAGGWPGALLAQQFLRHKSTKPEFRLAFWFTVVVNVAAFVLVCSPAGRSFWSP